jgi:hypothetical protein
MTSPMFIALVVMSLLRVQPVAIFVLKSVLNVIRFTLVGKSCWTPEAGLSVFSASSGRNELIRAPIRNVNDSACEKCPGKMGWRLA